MIKTTKAQRRALFAKWQQSPGAPFLTTDEIAQGIIAIPFTYKQFRRRAVPVFAGDGAILIPWCGMWLGIEPDGYCHS